MMGYRGYGYGGPMMGGSFLGGLLALVFFALVIAGVVLLVILLVRASSGHAPGGAGRHPAAVGHDEAVAIAKRRLASGEITTEQYAEIMRTLSS